MDYNGPATMAGTGANRTIGRPMVSGPITPRLAELIGRIEKSTASLCEVNQKLNGFVSNVGGIDRAGKLEPGPANTVMQGCQLATLERAANALERAIDETSQHAQQL